MNKVKLIFEHKCVRLQVGYMLIEVLVAVTVIAVAMVAVVTRVSDALAVNRLSQEQAVATRMAEEAVEWLRANRQDLGWDGFLSAAGLSIDGDMFTQCWDNLPITELTTGSSCPAPVNGDATYSERTLILILHTSGGENRVEYNVTVGWDFGNRQEQVQLTGNLYKGEYE